MRKIWKNFTSTGSSKIIQDKENRIYVSKTSVVGAEAKNGVTPYIPSQATLERLPTEIRSVILLKVRDIASLKALVHASPMYHSVYLIQRQAILERVLFNCVHPDVLYDAFSALHSSTTLTSNSEERVVRVKAFLSKYKDDREDWTPPEHLDLQSLFRLVWLQNQVQCATEDFCQIAFSSHPFTGKQTEHGRSLSSNEIRRFYRAFYRFEIFCNLFRNWKDPSADSGLSDSPDGDRDSASELDSMEKSSRFLSLFNPWEVEELSCVRDYFYSYYRRMLHKFEPDLRKRSPNLDLSDDGPWLAENIEYLMALSLRFYRRVETASPGRQMRLLGNGLHSGPPFLSDALKEPPLAAVYQTLAVDDVEEVHFEGDNVCGGPNVMWLWVTDEKKSFDYFLWQNEPLREWGYVFWDQQRCEKWDVPNEDYEFWVERRRAGLRKALAEGLG